MVSPNQGHLEVSNEAHSAPHSHVEIESNSVIIGSDAELAARDAIIKSILIKLALE